MTDGEASDELELCGLLVADLVCQHHNGGSAADNAALVDGLSRELRPFGWEFAGAGFFSVVFVRGDFALKIGTKPEDAGAMYAAWCRANPGGPGVPVVYAIGKFDGCYLALLKRYEAAPLSAEHRQVAAELWDILTGIMRGGAARFEQTDCIRGTVERVGFFFRGVADPDITPANVMLDPATGAMVLTDPLSHGPCSRYGEHDEAA